MAAKEDLHCSSLFELTEEDEPPFTSGSYEYESDSDLDDEEGDNMATAQSAEELSSSDEASSCHDQRSQTLDPDAQSHNGLSVCACISSDDTHDHPKI